MPSSHDSSTPSRVAIVGAGAAGLGAAYALRDPGRPVTIFEKSRGVFGRAATRRRGDVVYDHGANYVRGDDPNVATLIQHELSADGLVEILEPIWTFDRAGGIAPGEPSDHPRWSYRDGITRLGKLLLAASGAELQGETRVRGLARTADGWSLDLESGEQSGPFDLVLLTPPAPQTVALLEATTGISELAGTLASAAREARYRSILSIVLHYPFRPDLPYYALINTDREHPIGWLSREECKPGHVPAGESVLVAQMAPDWTRERLERDPAANAADAARHVAALLGDARLATPDWWDQQRWRYALPDSAAGAMDEGASHGLYFAGDWIAGAGRVHVALRSGLDIGRRMATALMEGTRRDG